MVEDVGRARTGSDETLVAPAATATSSAPGINVAVSDWKKVWFIGSPELGTNYSGSELMKGIMRLIKKTAAENLPDAFVMVDGGAAPSIPSYGTKGGNDELRAIEKGVETLDEAAVVAKQILNPIMEAIKAKKPGMETIYDLGANDIKNIRNRNYDRIINAYDHRPRQLYSIKASYLKKIAVNDDIIDTLVKQKERNAKRLEKLETNGGNGSAAERKRVLKENIADLDETLAQYYEENADYNEIVDLYTQLQKDWIRAHHDAKIKEIKSKFGNKDGSIDSELIDFYWSSRNKEDLGSVQGEYRKVKKSLDKVDETKFPEKYAAIVERAKLLTNTLKRLTYEEMDKAQAGAERDSTGMKKAGEIFTGNITVSRGDAESIYTLSEKEVLAHIRNSFGRRRPVRIYNTIYEDVSIGAGGVIRLTGNPTIKSSLFRDNIGRTTENMLNIGGGDERGKITFLIGGRSANGEVKAIPVTDRGGRVFQLLTPPFLDTEALAGTWKKGIKTTFTRMYENAKFKVSSGFWEVGLDDLHPSFTFHTGEELKRLAEEDRREEFRVLISKMRGVKPMDLDSLSIDNKDELRLKYKPPSEFNRELVNKLLVLNGIDPHDGALVEKLVDTLRNGETNTNDERLRKVLGYLKPYMVKVDEGEKEIELRFKSISDMHIGSTGLGVPTALLIEAYEEYERSNGLMESPYTLLLLGDIIDASYKEFNLENNRESTRGNIENFKMWLQANGRIRGSPEFDLELYRYKAYLLDKTPIINVDDQKSEVARLLKPWVIGAYASLIAGGNHYQMHERKRDETTALINIVKPYMESPYDASGREKLINMFGGDYGIGYGSIGPVGIFAEHEANTNIFTKLRTDAHAAFAGNDHIFRIQVVENKPLFTIPQSAPTNAYPTQINIPTSEELRGFADISMKFVQKGDGSVKLMNFTVKPIFERMLRGEGYLKDPRDELIKQFESGLNHVEVPPQAKSRSNGNGTNGKDKNTS